ncbi:metallophosphoesterase [Desnuesiella massiliensis]|uniref:metallophosphoesterase n=1 Tax=Desnuesiella massiliensis TaxID=1650662 RepID=UPI0006E21800|nr:metallophosphoesterase [Desnuesiella massiliensis]
MKIRPKLIIPLFILIILSLLWHSRSSQTFNSISKIKSGKEITFFVTNDVHYLAKDLTDGGEAFQEFINSGDGKQLNYIDEIVNAFTRDIKNKKPDILIISGDLTSNGEAKSHLELSKKLKNIEKLGTSVYVIPGNHDVQNPHARSFKNSNQYKTDTISNKDFAKIYEDFGYSEAISRDENTLSYLVSPSEDIWLLMLDTAQYGNNEALGFPQVYGMISEETLQWIKKCSDLAKEHQAKLITVMHHNLLDHNNLLKENYTLDNNEDAIEVLQNCGVDLVLSGHIHIQDIALYKKDNKSIYDIATSSLGVYPQQYGVIKYSNNKGYDYFTSKVDVEAWAKQEGIKDKNITSFKTYSKDFFENRANNRANKNLSKMDGYTDSEKALMAETMKLVNLKYFEGTANENKEEFINSQGFKLWQNAPDSFMKSYITGILDQMDISNNKLQFKN